MSKFTIHVYQDGDEKEINKGFNEAFKINRPISEWYRKFHPVYEKSWIVLTRDLHGELISQYAVVHERMQHNGTQIHAGQPVDVYRLRREGTADLMIFTPTVLKFFETFCAPDKLAYLFGFPGRRALKVGQSRLGYGDAIPIYVYTKSVPSKSRIDRLRSPKQMSVADADMAMVDELWLRAVERYPFSIIRDSHRLRRRYIDVPNTAYYFVSAGKQHQYNAWGVVRVMNDVLKWIDIVWDGQHDKHLQQLEQAVVRFAQAQNIDSIETWVLGDKALIQLLSEQGWDKSPEPFVHFVGRAWNPDLDVTTLNHQMYITLSDSDLV